MSPPSRQYHRRAQLLSPVEISRPFVPSAPVGSDRHAMELLEYSMKSGISAVRTALQEQQEGVDRHRGSEAELASVSAPTVVTAQSCPTAWLHLIFAYIAPLSRLLPASRTCQP